MHRLSITSATEQSQCARESKFCWRIQTNQHPVRYAPALVHSLLLQQMIQLQPLKTFSLSYSKAQEHCRAAMTALNSNDVEKARQAIRAALALLD
ncbi:hypothetical protein L208DRAFT_1401447 [Tricholoma matsutake]|nr:hypothetical protein L208DRAFT_1401420 [Tricholoma matsutake 945]KAF8229868.1 hypothetical protein L208DRAFT_1401447 [Tricholoma matsutake 945]